MKHYLDEKLTDTHCKALTAEGKPCGMACLKDESFCFVHSQKNLKARRQAAAKGGARSRKVPNAAKVLLPATLFELRLSLTQAGDDVMMHTNSLKRAQTLARVVLANARLIVLSEMIPRIERLESRIESIEKGWRDA